MMIAHLAVSFQAVSLASVAMCNVPKSLGFICKTRMLQLAAVISRGSDTTEL